MDSIQGRQLSGAERNELMQEVKEKMAIVSFQELLSKITEKCFKKCVNKPGATLDNSEQKCVAMCMDRYLESSNIIVNAFNRRIRE